MKTTTFNPSLLDLFTAPTAKTPAAKKELSPNMRLRFALQDAKAWQSKQPLAYDALEAIFAARKINLRTLLGQTDAKGKLVPDALPVVPDTTGWDLTNKAWTPILDECREVKAAYKAAMAAFATPTVAQAKVPTVTAPVIG